MDHFRNETRADRFLNLTRAGLAIYILFFPLGQFFHELGSITACLGLVGYYATGFEDSNLRRLPVKWLYAVFLAVLAVKAVHTIHPSLSLYAVRHNFYKGPALLLAALESVRTTRQLKAYMALAGASSFMLGLHGSWDFLSTGNIAAKRYGNLQALLLPVFFCLPSLMPRNWSRAKRLGLAALAALPGLFMWAACQARSGWFGLCVAAFAFVWLRWGTRRALPVMVALLAMLFMFRPGLLSPTTIMSDARWEIWSVALDEFRAHPLMGVGLNAFEPAYKDMGYQFDPDRYDLPVPHPHNVYLQFMAETGLVGLAAFLAFAGGCAIWGARRILANVTPRGRPHWLAAACLWSAYLGYLMTAFSAHNFYRTWWLGMAFTILGLMLGACMAREADEDPVADPDEDTATAPTPSTGSAPHA